MRPQENWGGTGNNIVDIQDGYGHYYTYVNSYVEHNEKIVKGSYIQNYYNRGAFNLKGANVSTLKVYNASQNSNCVFSIIGIKGDGTIVMLYIGNAMTEQTKDVSDIELLIGACYTGQCRLRFD